ncbi:angiogenic factor with G patch and FHA domains 1-like isoform X2 [Mytilus galloprovincialis]|uniref:angiogenic factor with G patch and FHA domains 1-like isoform X2 n=1 Tax=Mytilus galloprovincialis TaxID=29158 RepID=UPI003F7C422E
MEPDSTESSKCEAVSSENEIGIQQFPNVQSSQISSCDDNPGHTVESSTDINRTINITSSLCDETNSTEEMLQDGNERLKHLHVQNIEPEVLLISEDQPGSSKVEEVLNSEENSDSSEISESVKLTDKELEHVEESVLRKYTGLDIDLASENQLLKEDVIKCRCELEKYGKRLAAMERKLEKANNYNEDLRTQVDKLSAELHEYRREKHKVYTNSDTQTSAEDLMEVDDTLYDVNIPGTKSDGDTTFDWSAEPAVDAEQTPTEGDSLQTPGMSIADSLKATAEAAMNMTGFVYDQQSGLYYDYSTGYYYNAEKGLYYDPKSGTYFYFNKSTGKYEYHSKVDLSYYTPQSQVYPERPHGSYHHGYSDKHSDKHSDRYSERSPEHSTSSSGKKKKKKDSKRRGSDDKEPKRRDSDEKVNEKYEEVLSAFDRLSVIPESLLKNAACIRAMVTASDLLDEGMLFVVTVQGGMIGRETRNDLVIPVPDINVSKVHAEIRYNAKQQFYAIQDKGSQNGTYVNEVRISEAKHVSKWVQLKHGDTLQLSCTRFDLHIHPGTETCDKCEPGVVVQKTLPVMTSTTDSKDKKKQHREQLKNIKKKYGLTNSSYTDNAAAINNPAYQDKASERRRTVGSDNPHKLDDKPSSVHRRIDGDNKGHKMLKKLGWTEGESLGKDNAGIQDPINVNIRVDKAAGLGAYGTSNSLSIENIGIVNARRRFVQTQIRFSLGTQEKTKDKQFDPLMWVQGETQDNSLINEESNKDE